MKVLVAGGGGFIGGHLVKSLLDDGHDVRSVDQKPFDDWYQVHDAAENVVADLQYLETCMDATKDIDRVFNLAADMGGMGFIENNKALCMLSVLINTHLLESARANGVSRYFYSSSACVYAADKQTDPNVTALAEADAYPAMPEDGYGWEKLFSERMCRHFTEDFGLETRVARFHNVYGPEGTWTGGREKAPAAVSRKIAEAKISGDHVIGVWGDGLQTRSFMYIDDCIEGVKRLMDSDVTIPINIGSAELISINDLYDMVAEFAGIEITREHDLTAPQGVRGRNSDNTLILELLGWEPAISLQEGMRKTYDWVNQQVLGSTQSV
ncbi:MAG: NAD-dependent epimerase/dehydratase family protein [Acidimicrobiales bacterium]|nr:NAD-dependent epimerase/dehydratase family protein [Acidimicrobiales bacterium]RZV45633.1 MAG: NAD-dependent epimerase/dehydratase family protein [Acidimicrobiales bacterium]